jgi:hypothetical protein
MTAQTAIERLLIAIHALPDDQFAGAFPIVLLLLRGERQQPLPADLQAVLDGFTNELGLVDPSPEAARAAMAAHAQRHRLSDSLWRELMAVMQQSPDVLAAAAKTLGVSAPTMQPRAPAPAGSVTGGPMARFAALQALDQKSDRNKS